MSDDRTHVYPVVIDGELDEETRAWMRTQEFPIDGGINGLAAGAGEVVWTDDYLVDPRIPHEPDDQGVAERMGLRAMAAAPLRAPGGEVIGTLAVSYRAPRTITSEELSLLQGLADHAAIALANSRLLERLATSEARYRFLVQSSPDLIWSADADGRFTFLSDRSSQFFGHRPDELVGRHWAPVVHPSSLEEANRRWAGVLANPSEPQHVRLTLIGPGGTPFESELSTIAMVGPTGAVEGALGSIRDISEQQRLERELRDSEARYRYLVQSSPDCIWLTDHEGRFTFWNENVEGLLGRSSHELVGMHFSEIVAAESLSAAGTTWQRLQEEPGLVIRTRIVLTAADGGEVPADVSAVAIFEDGRFAGSHGTLRDLRGRERLERELRESEARYRFLVQSSPDIVWEVDADGRFTFASDAASATGWAPDELVGRHFSDVVHPSTLGEAAARWEDLLREPTLVHQARFSLLHRDGGEIPVENFSTGIIRNGRFVGAHGSARNLSERLRMERDLRRQAAELAASSERAHLARELHDSVTQALFSMTLVSRSVEMQVRTDPEAALETLGQLRELQREALAEMRSLVFELRPGSIERDGLDQALRTHVAALESRLGLPIVIDVELPERLPIEVEEALYRIAQEALHNVVKHASARQVRLGVGRTRSGARLIVEDDGRGFDPASVPAGHLGLTGMQARAERLGGRFTVRSAAGGGTRVEVIVPIEPGTIAAAPEAGGEPSA
jgi:PAS domain S-box-containing protein